MVFQTSFIQVLHENTSRYIRFPAEEFSFLKDAFEISIGNNHFSMEGMKLDIHDGDFQIKADVRYNSHIELERRILSPSVMGFFSYIPGMQCKHGVLSLHNESEGFIEINGNRTDASNLYGYVEKDWGEAFPLSWLWIQGNGINGSLPFSIMCSINNCRNTPQQCPESTCLHRDGRGYPRKPGC